MSAVGDVIEVDGHRYEVIAIGDQQGRFEPRELEPGHYWVDGLERFRVSTRSIIESFLLDGPIDGPVRLFKEIP